MTSQLKALLRIVTTMSRFGQEIFVFFFSDASRPALGLTQPLVQWVRR